jgi:hypothetical protein
MLTKADDYPIHQTPDPIAFAGTHQNFYDRYWFNGYSSQGDLFFGIALGVYPYRRIIDGSFSVTLDRTQHSIHASRAFNLERMETFVGPIHINVLEPLNRLEVTIAENEYDISGVLTFEGRCQAILEPRFTHQTGPRVTFDYTRLTQNGTYSGWLNIQGQRVEVSNDNFFGTRDRSWGIRPIGNLGGEPMASPLMPQYFWIWAPINYEDCVTYFGTNEDADGIPWHRSGMLLKLDDKEPLKTSSIEASYEFQSGTRHVKNLTLNYKFPGDDDLQVFLEPQYHFYMAGLGYSNPSWGHAVYKGDNVTGYEAYNLDKLDETEYQFLHVQAFVKARMESAKHGQRQGMGILEQTILGPHTPTGFKEIYDMAP